MKFALAVLFASLVSCGDDPRCLPVATTITAIGREFVVSSGDGEVKIRFVDTGAMTSLTPAAAVSLAMKLVDEAGKLSAADAGTAD